MIQILSTLSLLSVASLVASAPTSTSTSAASTSTSQSVVPASNSTNSTEPILSALNAQGLMPSNQSGPFGLDNSNCQDLEITAHANSSNIAFQDIPQTSLNQTYLSQTILQFLQFQSNYTAAHMNGTMIHNTKDYKIAGKFCSPKQGSNDNLLVAVHGIGFDQSYWDFSAGDEYSFVKHANSYGYPIFTYDRLGCGKSETPENGIDETQVNTEISILTDIVSQIKNSTVVGNKQWTDVVGVGHSYGSIQIQAATSRTPSLFKSVVLTGFSSSSAGVSTFVPGADYQIANSLSSVQGLSTKPSSWIATGSKGALITQFLSPIFNTFSEKALDLAFSTEAAVTLGAFFTQATAAGPAPAFNGSVFVINGAEDLPFCNSNCYMGTNGSTIPAEVQALYPASSNFTSSVVPNCGHGISPHYAAADAYEQVMSFIVANSP